MPEWLFVSSITLFLLILVIVGRCKKSEGFRGGHHGGSGHHGGGHHGGSGWYSSGGYNGGGWYGWYPPLTQCYRDWWGNIICSIEPEYRPLPPWW